MTTAIKGAGSDMFELPLHRVMAAASLVTLLSLPGLVPGMAASKTAVAGKKIYNTYCVLCHGANMVNTGSAAPDLRKFPLNQKSRFKTSVSKGTGQGKMPAWGDILTANQINSVWAYIRSRGKI